MLPIRSTSRRVSPLQRRWLFPVMVNITLSWPGTVECQLREFTRAFVSRNFIVGHWVFRRNTQCRRPGGAARRRVLLSRERVEEGAMEEPTAPESPEPQPQGPHPQAEPFHERRGDELG